MKVHQGVYLPDHELHLIDWMTRNREIVDGKGTYQIAKLRKAIGYCQNFRTAVDVGAHCGLWSMQLVKKFGHVHAFEPVAEHRECFRTNIWSRAAATLHECALGEVEGSVKMQTTNTSSGDTRVDGDGDIPLRTLDSFGITDVDFIKLDCEGYELFALRGGYQTIVRDMPVICVEQKPGRAQRFGLPEVGAVEWLQSLGYKVAEKMSGDFVMVPG